MAIPQLTVRGVDDELADLLRRHADSTGMSLSQAALDLLRRGAGLASKPVASQTIGHSLDPWFGTWSEQEASAVAQAVADFSTVDPELWR